MGPDAQWKTPGFGVCPIVVPLPSVNLLLLLYMFDKISIANQVVAWRGGPKRKGFPFLWAFECQVCVESVHQLSELSEIQYQL